MEDENKPKNLTAGHLQQLKAATQDIRREVAASGANLEHLPKEVRKKLLGDRVWWAWLYELSIIQHSALFYYSLGLIEPIKAALAASEDKLQAFLDFERNYEPDDKTADDFLDSEANVERRALCSCTLIALLRQIECLERDGCYMSDLVAKVAKGGAEGDEAFFKALRVDRTVVSCPTFGERISRAALEDDQPFFANLAKGIKTKWKKASPKKQESHKDLRILLQASHEAGQLQALSMTEADQLFIQELGVYSDEGEDPARSLQRFILRFRNNK